MPMEFVTELPYDHPYRWDGTLFGGPKLWRPSDIGSPIALWLDAEDTSTITLNGSTVSQWNDKSGNGRDVLQGTATSQPAYGAALINGKPALSFDGVDDAILTATTNVSFSNSASVFAVQNNTATTGNGGSFDFIFSPNFIDIFSAAPNQIRWEIGNSSNGTLGSNTHTVVSNTPYIFSGVGNTSLINGGDQKTFAQTGVISGSINSGIRLGAYFSPYKGTISELVMLPSVATVNQRQRIEGYLAWKWKLQANLPVGHPYKSLPPTA